MKKKSLSSLVAGILAGTASMGVTNDANGLSNNSVNSDEPDSTISVEKETKKPKLVLKLNMETGQHVASMHASHASHASHSSHSSHRSYFPTN